MYLYFYLFIYLLKLIQSKYTLVEGCNGRTTVYADPSDSWKNGDDILLPSIIVISPPHIGPKITESFPSFNEDAIEESKKFATYYKEIKKVAYFDAASYIEPSKIDSLHLSLEAHATLANKLAEILIMALQIKCIFEQKEISGPCFGHKYCPTDYSPASG